MKVARFGLGWNQENLADALDVSVTTISQYERGRRKRFTRGMAMALEEALGIADKALLVALGYENPPADAAPGPGRQTLSYKGAHLDPEGEQKALDYIDWIRSRDTSS